MDGYIGGWIECQAWDDGWVNEWDDRWMDGSKNG